MNDAGKVTLWRIIKVMFLLLLFAFAYVLFSGTRVSSPSDQQPQGEFNNINVGETVLRTLQSRRVWLTHISDQQRLGYVEVTPHVISEGGCSSSSDFCALAARTKVAGINLSFTKDKPPQVPNGAAWVSGFVDPTSGAVYDLWGRAYQFSGAVSLKVISTE